MLVDDCWAEVAVAENASVERIRQHLRGVGLPESGAFRDFAVGQALGGPAVHLPDEIEPFGDFDEDRRLAVASEPEWWPSAGLTRASLRSVALALPLRHRAADLRGASCRMASRAKY
jgi:hypothetical protein